MVSGRLQYCRNSVGAGTFSVRSGDMYRLELLMRISVIEVGMGGRLDCTNIIQPDLCIITNIGFDHMQYLGDTLPKIATVRQFSNW